MTNDNVILTLEAIVAKYHCDNLSISFEEREHNKIHNETLEGMSSNEQFLRLLDASREPGRRSDTYVYGWAAEFDKADIHGCEVPAGHLLTMAMSYIDSYSDAYKNLHGCRPRGGVRTPDHRAATDQDDLIRVNYEDYLLLVHEGNCQYEEEKKEQEKNLLDFKAEIEKLREQFPADRVTASGTQTEDRSRFRALKIWIDTRDGIDFKEILNWDGDGLEWNYLCYKINVDYTQADDLQEWVEQF